MTENSDEALMRRAATGDARAFGTVAARHLPRLVLVARRVLDSRSDAEEVAQEALLRAWKHAGRYDPARAKVTTWLHTIALNLALDRVRSARPMVQGVPEDLADPGRSAWDMIVGRERDAALAAGIAALPPRQRAALLLTYAEERPGAEAASMLGVSTRALEGLLRRGRLFLRAWLTAHHAP